MDEDLFAYAVVTEKMPPENRLSCLAESLAVALKVINRMMKSQGLTTANFGRFELDHTKVADTKMKRDSKGNVTVTAE